jgi:hypothetical protein
MLLFIAGFCLGFSPSGIVDVTLIFWGFKLGTYLLTLAVLAVPKVCIFCCEYIQFDFYNTYLLGLYHKLPLVTCAVFVFGFPF